MLKKIINLSVVALIAASCSNTAQIKNVKIVSSVDSASYVYGHMIGADIEKGKDQLPGEKINIDLLARGIVEGLNKKESAVKVADVNAFLQNYFTNAGKIASEKYLQENGKKKGVVTTASGLQYEILKDTVGPKPTATDMVKVHYHGTLTNGTVFDSSVQRGEPVSFPLNGVIKGWTEGLQLMSVGSKYKFTIPSELAYGEQGQRGIPPHSVLVFEVELLDIVKQPAEAPTK